MLEDDDLLDGVPDDAPAVTDADLLDDDEEEVDEDAGGKRGRQSAADADDAMEPAGLSRALEDDPPERAAAARKSGKRRIIQHVAKEDGGGIDPHDPAEVARRNARASKFGTEAPPPAAAPPTLIGREEVLARAERAKKFGVEKAANPLDAIASAAGGVGKTKEAGLWEKRRDAAADEVPRDEAIYVYGTARTPTSRPASSRALLAPFP